MLLFPTAYTPEPMLLLACAFALVAAGCSLSGALTSRVSRLLGEPTYSIYLLDGLVPVPVLLALAWASYRWIEMPALRLLPGLGGRQAQAAPGTERPAASL